MRHLIKLGANPAAVAFSMTTLGAGMMNSIFSFYYVKLFLNKYQISEGAFHQSQVVYMIWNAVNDPLFGYLQDNSKVQCCSRRRLAILYGAPLYSLAFLLAWYPWREYGPGDWMCGLHLTVALCAFDGMLTFVLLSQCALFAEISGHHQSRLRLIKYNQVASLIGSSSVLFCGLYSRNMEDYSAFQSAMVLVAVLSCGCMLYTGFHSEGRFDNKGSVGASPPPSSSAPTEPGGDDDKATGRPALSFAAVVSMTCQILSDRNFQLFVVMNFFQVFMLAFFNNFTMIITEHLIPLNVLPPLAKSLMYGAGFICPQILVLSSQKLLLDVGYYKMILCTFYVEGVMAMVMLALGPQHHYVLAVFLSVNMVLIQASFSLFNLPLADIIDSDRQKYKRSSPLSSMVFGTNALFTKPAQSLAPMLVVTILNQFNYEDLKVITKTSDPEAMESLHSIMFYLVCLIPLIISTTQALAWRPFSIRNSHTVDTKYIDG